MTSSWDIHRLNASSQTSSIFRSEKPQFGTAKGMPCSPIIKSSIPAAKSHVKTSLQSRLLRPQQANIIGRQLSRRTWSTHSLATFEAILHYSWALCCCWETGSISFAVYFSFFFLLLQQTPWNTRYRMQLLTLYIRMHQPTPLKTSATREGGEGNVRNVP